MRFRRSIFLAAAFSLIFIPASLVAQFRPVEFGFKAGVPLNKVVEVNDAVGQLDDDSIRFTGGGLIQLNLPLGLAIEANALYKRPGFENLDFRKRASQWEFPILAKVYPLGRNPLIQPYGGAGLSFRRTATNFAGIDVRDSDKGFVAAAGIRNGPGRIKISPEFRYTRWFRTTTLLSAPESGWAGINKNQLEFLVGITF